MVLLTCSWVFFGFLVVVLFCFLGGGGCAIFNYFQMKGKSLSYTLSNRKHGWMLVCMGINVFMKNLPVALDDPQPMVIRNITDYLIFKTTPITMSQSLNITDL